jgi:mannose-1-phosphate guanylyltransferase/phosphomannomutase
MMKAVVMAGGEGSRLRPLTIGRPKPMVPMVSKPVMGHILDLLKRYGFTEVVVTLHFMPEAIQSYFDGQNLGIAHYAIEETSLGTAAGRTPRALTRPSIISGDAVTDINLQRSRSTRKSAEATITSSAAAAEYGSSSPIHRAGSHSSLRNRPGAR